MRLGCIESFLRLLTPANPNADAIIYALSLIADQDCVIFPRELTLATVARMLDTLRGAAKRSKTARCMALVYAMLGTFEFSELGTRAAALGGEGSNLILLVGFAILKKPPMGESWWMIKLGLWLFIGAAPALAKRKMLPAPVVLVLCIVAATAAAWLGLTKPF